MSRTVPVIAVTLLTGLGGLWLGSGGLAQAAETAPAVPHVRHGYLPQREPLAGTHRDEFWAGYTSDGTRYTSITGSWTVPATDCSTVRDSATSPWIGLDGYDRNSPTVEQIGIDDDCTDGKLHFEPWVEMYPKDSEYFTEPISVGDVITASVTWDGGNAYTLTEADTTQQWSKTFHLSARGKHNSAEAIFEDLGRGIQPVAPFSTVTFTGLTADGKPLAGVGKLHATNLTRGRTPLTATSALDGDSFTLSWLAAVNG